MVGVYVSHFIYTQLSLELYSDMALEVRYCFFNTTYSPALLM